MIESMSGRNSQMVGVSNITNRTDPNSLKSRVFVGNLNTVHMTKTELESIFVKYGAIIGISVHKGYAFIQYANEASARAAVAAEDCKAYYSMALDVTIASEPKNRKRGRSNVNTNLSAWSGLSSSGIPDLTLQAQALSNLASNPVLSSLQQLGLEGIMGQPNFSQFAAAAAATSSVLRGTSPLSGFNFGTPTSSTIGASRPKHTRSSGSQLGSYTSVSTLNTSSSAKRTRLEGMIYSQNNSNSTLPAGARGQNLVSLVSPTTDTGASAQANKSSSSDQRRSGSGLASPAQSRLVSTSTKTSNPPNVAAPSKRPLRNNSIDQTLIRVQSEAKGRLTAEDILICGSCRRLFEQVDDLITHKMAGCSLNQGTCQACRCRSGAPEVLECAYCGASFHAAWDLMHHCHNDHGLTIYTIPSPGHSPAIRNNPVASQLVNTKQTTKGDHPSDDEADGSPERKGKSEMQDEGSDDHDKLDSQSQDEVQTGSDWERDPDEYAVEAGVAAPIEETDQSIEPHLSHSPSCSPTHSIKDDEVQHNGDDEDSSSSTCSKQSCRETVKSSEPPHSHRRRGGEYGRHETMADDEEEDVADDDDDEVPVNADVV